MDLAKDEVSRAYAPYRKESSYCLIMDIIVSSVGCIVFIIGNIQFHVPFLFLAFPVYFFLEAFINYRLSLLSLLEAHRQAYIHIDLYISELKTEDSLSGRWGSIIPKLYPKALGMQRYSMKCMDNNNNKVTIRCVMSNKNAQLLSNNITAKTPLKRTVIYGKYSHILIKYCDKDDLSFHLNRTVDS